MKLHQCLMAFLLLAPVAAASDTENEQEPSSPKLLIIGTFHFQDPGLDSVKPEDINVFEEDIQDYLESLTERLADFEPTHVMLEYNPENEDRINERYQRYRAGDFELPANEIYQLGFRIAAKAGLDRVRSLDNREIQWNPQALFEYGEANDSPRIERLQELIEQFTEEANRDRETLSMQELMLKHNDPERDRLNMDLYLLTNAIGAGDNWVGADTTSRWWQRNFRIYARLQQQTEADARIIAIAGQGHTAILNLLADIDRRIERVDPRPFLKLDAK